MTEDLKRIITEEDQWSLAEGENNSAPFILRFRPHLLPFVELQQYNIRLMVLLKYEIFTSNLLPSDEQYEMFERFENEIIVEVESNLSAVLAFVYTWNGQREWHFYTVNFKDAEDKITKILNDINYSGIIELQVEEDPEWNEYNSVLSGAED